jgi:hypothetical protein
VQVFSVERSADGVNFVEAGQMPPVPGGQLPTLYAFDDKTPFYGINYYRIRVVLEDSSEVLSNAIEVPFNVDLDAVFIYPNPATTDAILHIYPLNGLPARLFIANVQGQMVFEKDYDALLNEPIRLDLSNYPAGIYTIFLQPEGQREQVLRLVVSSP